MLHQFKYNNNFSSQSVIFDSKRGMKLYQTIVADLLPVLGCYATTAAKIDIFA